MSDRLKTRDQFPPGGWQFFQAETNWRLPNQYNSASFSAAVQMIQSHRRSNPQLTLSTAWEQVAWELETFNAMRCRQNGHLNFLVDAGQIAPPQVQPIRTKNASSCSSCGR